MHKTNQAAGHKDKRFITIQLGSIEVYFSEEMGRTTSMWIFIRLSCYNCSFCICVIYYPKRPGFAQVRTRCISFHIHIRRELWSFAPWYIFLADWNKGMNMNECEWIWMNINNPITNPILCLAFLLVNFRKFHGNGFWHKSTDTYPLRNFSDPGASGFRCQLMSVKMKVGQR